MPLVQIPCCWRCSPGGGGTMKCRRVCTSDCKQHMKSAPSSSQSMTVGGIAGGLLLPLASPDLYRIVAGIAVTGGS